MEKKIQELKAKLLNDLELFMHNSIEQFTTLLSDISNEYLVKTKERELELKDEVETLKKEKAEITVYINGSKEKAEEFIKKERELNDREQKIKTNEKEIRGTQESMIEMSASLNKRKEKLDKEQADFEKEKAQFKVKQSMVDEQVKTLRKLNI